MSALKKRSFFCLTVSIVLLLSVFICAYASDEDAPFGIVNVSTVNMRESDSMNSGIVMSVGQNEKVSVLCESNGFYKVKYNNKTGYILCEYISLDETLIGKKAYAAIGSLNIRTGPSTDNDIICIMDKNEEMTVLGISGTYYRVSCGKTEGYVSMQFVSLPENEEYGIFGKNTVCMITVNSVNLRESPSLSSNVIAKLTKQDRLSVISCSDGFYKVKVNGKTGYVASEYLIKADDSVSSSGSKSTVPSPTPRKTATPSLQKLNKSGTVNVDSLNVRERPDASSEIIDKLIRGTEVSIVAETNGFYQINHDHHTGYVAKQYISISDQDVRKSATASPSQKDTPLNKNGRTNVSDLNMRVGPSSDTGIIMKFSSGTEVDIIGENNGFYKIKYNGKTGYVSKAYVNIIEKTSVTSAPAKKTETVKETKKSGKVTSQTLNVRSEPSTESAIITVLSSGTALSITGETDSYYRITVNSRTGYVSRQYVTVITATQTPSAKAENTGVKVTTVKKSGSVISETLNVRKEASTSSAVLTVLREGTAVSINGETDEFYRIDIQGKTGYVAKQYVKIGSTSSGEAKASASADKINSLNAKGTVSSSTLNMRAAADKSSDIILVLNHGAALNVTGETKDFYRVSYNGKTGFVSKQYLNINNSKAGEKATASPRATETKPTEAFTSITANGTVNTDGLNMRKEASTSSDSLLKLQKGTTVSISAQSKSFYKIKYNGMTGYVAKQYVNIVKSTATPKSDKKTATPSPKKTETAAIEKFETYTATGKTNTSGLNLRKEASTSSKSLAVLNSGTYLNVIAQSRNFYKVKVDSITGYIAKQYVSIVKETPKPTAKSAVQAGKFDNVKTISELGAAPGYLSSGNSGEDVEKLQQALKIKGYYEGQVNGKFGSETKQALIAYQKAAGLDQTGKADYKTILKLFGKVSVTSVADDPKMNGITKISQISVPATSKKGDSGKNVLALQQALKIKGYYKAPINSVYDSVTTEAVKAYQKAKGITADGEAGFSTIKAIFGENAANYTYVTESLDWFKNGDNTIPKGAILTVKDVNTGKTFKVKRWSGANHADVEPLTASDTAVMKSLYGSWSWSRRAILVLYKGHVYAASMNGMPHGTSTINNNNFNGHFCIHFTGSKTHASKKVDPDHQAAIRRALKAKW